MTAQGQALLENEIMDHLEGRSRSLPLARRDLIAIRTLGRLGQAERGLPILRSLQDKLQQALAHFSIQPNLASHNQFHPCTIQLALAQAIHRLQNAFETEGSTGADLSMQQMEELDDYFQNRMDLSSLHEAEEGFWKKAPIHHVHQLRFIFQELVFLDPNMALASLAFLPPKENWPKFNPEATEKALEYLLFYFEENLKEKEPSRVSIFTEREMRFICYHAESPMLGRFLETARLYDGQHTDPKAFESFMLEMVSRREKAELPDQMLACIQILKLGYRFTGREAYGNALEKLDQLVSQPEKLTQTTTDSPHHENLLERGEATLKLVGYQSTATLQ